MLTRRELGLSALALGASAIGCAKQEKATRGSPSAPAIASDPSAAAVDPTPRSRLLEWDVEGPFGPGRAAIIVPHGGAANAKYPVLVALHGRGEAVKPPASGALGWARDYAMRRAIERVSSPPLADADFEGFSDPARLARINADLAARAYGGLIVACPHIPDVAPNGDARAIARFVIDVLLPRVRRETPAIDSPDATGIDGVSMGGALALRIGLTNPAAFGAVGSLQAAIAEEHVTELVELAKAARAKRPTLKLRLVTSHDDYFRDAIRRLSDAWRAAGIGHDFADVPGPHDYAFNRGPGSIELLTYYDRALR